MKYATFPDKVTPLEVGSKKLEVRSDVVRSKKWWSYKKEVMKLEVRRDEVRSKKWWS